VSKIKRHLEESMSWQDIANLTHATQVEKFNWCSCEEQEQFPYDDCPREGEGREMKSTPVICGDHLVPISDCSCLSYLQELKTSAERLIQLTQEREKMK
jgi:hypothetical protein